MVIASLIYFKAGHISNFLLIISGIFLSLGLIAPQILRPVYIIWMKFAFVLGWINTRIILIIMFYLVFTPIGICIRIFGKDLLERKIDKASDSYWEEREQKPFNQADYQRQF